MIKHWQYNNVKKQASPQESNIPKALKHTNRPICKPLGSRKPDRGSVSSTVCEDFLQVLREDEVNSKTKFLHGKRWGGSQVRTLNSSRSQRPSS